MLAVHSPAGVPRGDEWVHEVKWDGIRLMVEVVDGRVRLTNRNGVDVTVTYPELHDVSHLPADLLLDGEVVVATADASGFAAVMPRMHQRDPRRITQLAASHPVQYMVFDLLRLDGRDLTRLPLTERRALLDEVGLGSGSSAWQLPPQYDDGDLLAQATLEAGLEGVVSKRRSSPYAPGARNGDWVKVPHRSEFVGVIGGWVPEAGSTRRLGALWIGHPHDETTFDDDGLLHLVTRAGSGLGHRERDDLLGVLREIETDRCPFVVPPVGPDARRTHWVEPLLCVQVRHLGSPGAPLSRDRAQTPSEFGQLRQPVLRRLRPDVTPLEASAITFDEGGVSADQG